MLVAIISIYWITGTTDVVKLYEIGIDTKYQNLLWLAFFSSFAVKTPMWPVHTWLPDAHVEAPTAGSVLLAAILLKMAGYGFIRFSLGLFPTASEVFTPLIYTLSVIAIIFTSLIALMQEDMKKLIAYSSVAHMGFVTLGIFTIQQQGIEGSIIQMISHGLVSAALFLCVGVVYDRMHSRLINTYGGIVTIVPKYSVLFMIFTLAALGLPGTSGFVGEFLILMAAFKDNFLVAVLASLGVIIGAAYMLWLYKRVIFGKLINSDLNKMIDLNKSEIFILSCLAIPTLYFGFYPDPLINTIEVSISDLIDNYNFKDSEQTIMSNIELVFPEIFISLSIMFLLILGVFKKNSSKIIQNVSLLILLITAVITFNETLSVKQITLFNESVIIDYLSSFMKIVTLLAAFIVLLISSNYLRTFKIFKIEYPILILSSVLGMMIMISSNDLIVFYMGLELQSLALYVLATFDRDKLKSSEAGLKYFVLSALSSGLLLYGCSLIYGFTGSTNFNVIANQFNTNEYAITFGIVFILVGLAFKISAVPFHMWAPDVYEGSPTSVTLFLLLFQK